ncbi:MAG TPA: DUF1702 family protein, partial [Pseudonocardia sp.]|nr:DUF1702 family protein [Pseudonocardia sp.]
AVVCGFEWGADSSGLWELQRRLDMVEPAVRGFAYEGATMASVVVDAMSGWRRGRTRELLAGPGRPHLFLTYIGIGFAMARLPRTLWGKVVPDLDGMPYHPTMSWLAVDGYGFDLAYFHTERWVDRRQEPEPYPWEGSPAYFSRAVDQGIGRALWFIHGADVTAVAGAVRSFPRRRQPDLWSGVGLAASFAGGAGRDALGALVRLAGDHRSELALGAVFAAKARTWAGHVPAHTGVACAAFGAMPVQNAVALADDTAVGASDGTADRPAYEIWRSRIRGHFAPAARDRAG